MKCVIQIEYLGGQEMKSDALAGLYVQAFDPEAHAGRGFLETTPDLQAAKLFADFVEAWAFYRQPSQTRPLREDGQPNRPLTAFSVSFVPVAS